MVMQTRKLFQHLFLISAALPILLTTPATVAAQEKIAVVATGVGETASAAEKDALRRAVRSAVGLYVDSETLVKNEKLIRDQVLESTGSYVTSYRLTGDPVKRDGLFEVEIQAVVEGGQVAKRLEAAKLVQRGISTKNLVAEIEGKIENAREGAKILERNLPQDLLQKLLVARLVDAEGEPTNQIQPKRKVLADGRVETTWMVQTYFDTTKFYKEVVPPVHRMLAGISTASGGPVMSTARTAGELPLCGYPLHFYRNWNGSEPKAPVGDQPHCYMLLSTGRSADGGAERWNWYLLEGADYIKALKKIQMQDSFEKIQLKAEFLATDGGVVASTSFSPWKEVIWTNSYKHELKVNMAPYFLNQAGTLSSANHRKPLGQHMVISCRFAHASHGGQAIPAYSPSRRAPYPDAGSGASDIMMRRFSVTLDPQDLRRIVNVRFYFTMSASLK